MKKIINKWFNFLGYEIEIRMLPFEFKKDLKRITNLVDDELYEAARRELHAAYRRWGDDPELIRIHTYAEFMRHDLDE